MASKYFHVFLILTTILINGRMGFELQRVVFQTFLLPDGENVQCYGTCGSDIEDPTRKLQKFNVSRCEGRKIRLNCPMGYGVNVHTATLGRLNPELKICNPKQRLLCLKDITNTLREHCKLLSSCVFDVTNDALKESCGVVTDLSLDTSYFCELLPKTTPLPTDSSLMIPTTTLHNSVTFRKSPSPILITRPFQTEPYPTNVPMATATTGHTTWILAAYSMLSDLEFIRKNKTHLMLAVILSIFVGLVLSLCFMLDHCRRVRMKRARKTRLEMTDEPLLDDNDGQHGAEEIELAQINKPHSLTNGSLPTDNKRKFQQVKLNNNNSLDDVDEPLLLVSTKPRQILPKRTLQLNLGNARSMENQHQMQSPSSLPPPPKEFLEMTPSPPTSSNELIPPPPQFITNTDQSVPTLVVTCATPLTNSHAAQNQKANATSSDKAISTVSSTMSNKDIPVHSKHTDGSLITTPTLKTKAQTVKAIVPRSNGNCQNHSQAGYPGSVQINRKFDNTESNQMKSSSLTRKHTFNDTTNHVRSQNVKFALQRKSLSNEFIDTSILMEQEQFSAFTSPISIKQRTSNVHESPLFQTSRLNDKRKENMPNGSLPMIHRSPRKGRLHVIPSPQSDTTAMRKGTSTCKTVTITKHQCGSGHRHSCICIPTRSDSGEYFCSCIESSTTCCLRTCDPAKNLQNQIASGERKTFAVEESGYHSHETGTDSMCSSTRSTDQEDSHMFSPAGSLKPIGPARNKSCRIRDRNTRRDPKLVPVNVHSKTSTKSSRRTRYDNRSPIEVRPSESSLDDGSSRDSVNVLIRTKPKGKKREPLLDSKRPLELDPLTKGKCVEKGILKNGSVHNGFNL